MSVAKSSLKIISVVILLVVLAVIIFAATFDANNYKPQIIEQVEKATGRDFIIGGDINLSVFPWVGLKVEDVVLGNEKGFNAEQFAAIKQLDVKVNVLPLLKKQVEINTIRLHGLDISLEVAKDKSNNWSGLTKAEQETDTGKSLESDKVDTEAVDADQADSGQGEQQAASPLQSLKVEGFEFVDATIRYDDRSSETLATISELNLTTTAIEFDQPIDLQFGARIENNKPDVDTRLQLTTQLTINKELSEFKLREFVFTILAEANEFIKQDEKIVLSSDIDVSMDQQQVTLKSLNLSALQTETVADITVSQFLETPLIQGDFEVKPFDARKVSARVGVELPVMANDKALTKIAMKSKLKVQGNRLEANEFDLQLDGSTLSGWIHLLDISKQQLRYDLAFDKLNINDYLPPEPAQSEQKPAAVAQADAAKAPADSDKAAGNEDKIELPVEMMRELDIKGDLRIASLKAKEYDIKQLLMSLQAQKGIIAIEPLSLQVLEGQVKANTTINVQKAVPAYAINLDVNQVQAGPVANPYLDGVMGDEPITMTGAVDVRADVKTAGDTVTSLKKASKGKVTLDMKKTSVDGFDPEYYARKSISDAIGASGTGLSKTIMGDYKPREVTVFDKIHSTVNITDGKARTDDFLMDSKRVQIKAKGYADIIANSLDVTASTRLPRGKTAVEKILDEPVYVRIHGPFDALQYELDKDRLKKSTTDVLEKEAKAKAKQKIEEEKQRLKKKADEEIKRQEEKAKKKLEDSLKDKLKGLF